jgi:hypothetical protein
MPPFLVSLFASGLNLLGNAVLAKGQQFVEDKLGVKLEDMVGTDEGRAKLAQIEAEREDELREWVLAVREQELEYQKAQEANVTDRWKADMMSDSWLSKNIRPSVLVYLLTVFTIFAGLSAARINIGDGYVTLLSTLLEAVFYAYFGGRSLEKIASMIASKWGKNA